MLTYTVELGERSYPIQIGEGALDLLGEELARLRATRVLICTNTTVGPLYLERVLAVIHARLPDLPVEVVCLPDGERYKDLAHVEKILMGAVKVGLDRRSLMIALGGGVVGDMVGFAASMWMRGIGFIQIPTTLLAQVDSSVGGKTGVNLPAGKNLIGSFHQPKSVLVDPVVLRTLPPREVSAGIAEVIKYGFLGDDTFVDYLERNIERLRRLDPEVVAHVVAHCCRIKADIVKLDEKEGGVRAKLNLGHTFAHAIENLSGYGCWLHGEAVGLGMMMAADLSERLGYLTRTEVRRVNELIERGGLPTKGPCLDAQAAYRVMQSDKKSLAGKIRFVTMKTVGDCLIETVEAKTVYETMAAFGWK